MVSLAGDFSGGGLGQQRQRHGREWASCCARPWPEGAQRAPARCAGRQLIALGRLPVAVRWGSEQCAVVGISGMLERAGYVRGGRLVTQVDR